MHGLAFRLAVVLGVSVGCGLLALDAGWVLHRRGVWRDARKLQMDLCLFRLNAAMHEAWGNRETQDPTPKPDALAQLAKGVIADEGARIGAELGCEMQLLIGDKIVARSKAAPEGLAPRLWMSDTRYVSLEWVHRVSALPWPFWPKSWSTQKNADAKRPRWWISQSMHIATAQAQTWHREFVYGLGLTMILITVLGLWFLRGVVLLPLRRMVRWVEDGLRGSGLGSEVLVDADDLRKLGLGLVSLDQQHREQRAKIGRQLDALRLAHNALSETQSQLVRSERLAVVGKLAAGIAHEIGNPLGALRGLVAMLKDPKLERQTQAQALMRMEDALQRVAGIIRQLLDYSCASGRKEGLGDVAEVLDYAVGLASADAQMRDVEIVVASELQKQGCKVSMDADALAQVLLNLLLNASHAMQGKGSIHISRLDDAAKSAKRCVLAIEDTGPGIEDTLKSKIFEPFYTSKNAGEGTGLGLSVCERLVTLSGGEIWVEDGPVLGGARFMLSLSTPVLSTEE